MGGPHKKHGTVYWLLFKFATCWEAKYTALDLPEMAYGLCEIFSSNFIYSGFLSKMVFHCSGLLTSIKQNVGSRLRSVSLPRIYFM